MSPLPVVAGRDVLKALGKIGFALDRQQGSHMILRQESPPHRRLTVPDHREVAKGTLRVIIRQAGLTVTDCWNVSVTRYAGLGASEHSYLGLRSYLASPQAKFRHPLRGLKEHSVFRFYR